MTTFRVTFKLEEPMRWFGEPWNCRVCDPATKVATPVDSFCMQCERPVLERDQGVVLPFSAPPGFAILHLDCFLHSVGAIPCSPKYHPPTKETLS